MTDIEKRQDDKIAQRPQGNGEWWSEMENILAGFEGMQPVERERVPLRDHIEALKS